MSQKRFKVALSFPGERRDYVLQIAKCLAKTLGRETILYDAWHTAEFTRLDLNTYLPDLYHKHSELVIPFLCTKYDEKQWCGLEWRAIMDLIAQKQYQRIMPMRFDEADIPGLYDTSAYLDLRKHQPKEVAELILQRLRQIEINTDEANDDANRDISQAAEQKPSIQSRISLPLARGAISKPDKKTQIITALFALLCLAVFAWFLLFKTDPPAAWHGLLNQGEYQQAKTLCEQSSDQVCLDMLELFECQPMATCAAQAKGLQVKYPKSPYPHLILAEARTYREDWSGAKADYQQALSLNESIAQAHFGLGQIAQYGEHNLPAAKDHYQQAISLAPDNHRFAHNLASLYAELGEYQQAAEQYQKLAMGTDMLPHVEWINALLYQGDFKQAHVQARSLVEEVLQQKDIWKQALNQVEWVFVTPQQPIYLEEQADKLGYIRLQYALSAVLDDPVQAQSVIEALDGKVFSQRVSFLVHSELQKLHSIHTSPTIRQKLERFSSSLAKLLDSK